VPSGPEKSIRTLAQATVQPAEPCSTAGRAADVAAEGPYAP